MPKLSAKNDDELRLLSCSRHAPSWNVVSFGKRRVKCPPIEMHSHQLLCVFCKVPSP